MRPPIVLAIAGSDPSGGAGLQADVRTCTALGVYAAAVPTCLTVQDTRGVTAVTPLAGTLVRAQVEAVLADFVPDAIKIGLLPSAEVVEAVAAALGPHPGIPTVLDPVLAAGSGDRLASEEAVGALVRTLLPRAALVTPNAPEAARLAARPVERASDLPAAARAILALGPGAVLVKGGHLEGDAVDVLVERGAEPIELRGARLAGGRLHGTGCALSAAIAAHLARGLPLVDAVRAAKAWLAERIAAAAAIGRGARVLLP